MTEEEIFAFLSKNMDKNSKAKVFIITFKENNNIEPAFIERYDNEKLFRQTAKWNDLNPDKKADLSMPKYTTKYKIENGYLDEIALTEISDIKLHH